MLALQYLPKTEIASVQSSLDHDEILHFYDMLAPYQAFSLDGENTFDSERHKANKNLVEFLQSKYGESNVILSSLNCNGHGHAEDVPGMIGVYVKTLAFEMVNYIDNLEVVSRL
jgi:hypothetical protein